MDLVVLKGGDHLVHELFGVQVHDVGARIVFQHPVADGVHEVRLAEPGAAVDEQGVVVRVAGAGRDLYRSRESHLVGLAGDEAVEGEFVAQPVSRTRVAGRVRTSRPGRRRLVRSVAGGERGFATPDVHGDVRHRGFASGDDAPDPIEELRGDRIADEVVRCEQPEARSFLDRVERTDPRVELLRRQIDFKAIETALPGR